MSPNLPSENINGFEFSRWTIKKLLVISFKPLPIITKISPLLLPITYVSLVTQTQLMWPNFTLVSKLPHFFFLIVPSIFISLCTKISLASPAKYAHLLQRAFLYKCLLNPPPSHSRYKSSWLLNMHKQFCTDVARSKCLSIYLIFLLMIREWSTIVHHRFELLDMCNIYCAQMAGFLVLKFNNSLKPTLYWKYFNLPLIILKAL